MSPPEKRARTLVKVCGIRSPELARMAFEAGADAVGVVLVPGTPRAVTAELALRIAEVDPLRCVLVLRDPDAETVDFASIWRGPVQFHPPFAEPRRRHIRAMAGDAISGATSTTSQSAWLLDAPAAGSGEAWSWPAHDGLPEGLPVILAGGLTPDNVAEAIRKARPWAVDVSSGVERERGVKDPTRIRAFIDAVRACDHADGRTLTPSPAGFDALR